MVVRLLEIYLKGEDESKESFKVCALQRDAPNGINGIFCDGRNGDWPGLLCSMDWGLHLLSRFESSQHLLVHDLIASAHLYLLNHFLKVPKSKIRTY